MPRKLTELKIIDSETAMLLKKSGINISNQLLDAAGVYSDRKSLAKKISIKEEKLLEWVNICDLFRINEISDNCLILLFAAGIDSVRALRSHNAECLVKQLSDINSRKRICSISPDIDTVSKWIERARMIKPKVFHNTIQNL